MTTPPRDGDSRLRTARPARSAVLAGIATLAGIVVIAFGVFHSGLLPGSGDTGSPAGQATLVTAPDTAAPSLSEDFDALLATFDGQASIALAPVGGGQVLAFGDDIEDVAWSTMKVPLSIAALRENGDAVLDLVESAITYSDNDATWTLWTSLGEDPDTWIDTFDAILREGGDQTTVFETDRLESGSPSWGESLWDDADQVRFAAGLPCIPDSGPVLEYMGQIDEEQRWGLGAIEGARFKGGWGPGEGEYLTRQFGILDTPRGQVAVAIVALPASGGLEDGNAMLDAVAQWIVEHEDQLPAGAC